MRDACFLIMPEIVQQIGLFLPRRFSSGNDIPGTIEHCNNIQAMVELGGEPMRAVPHGSSDDHGLARDANGRSCSQDAGNGLKGCGLCKLEWPT